MAGGTWTVQNKVRPGVYINFDSTSQTGLTIGTRGVVAICEPMSWGAVGQVMTVNAGSDTTPYCGYPIYEPGAQFLNEIFKGTNRTNPPTTVLLYRPAADSSVQATATEGSLTATALYPGVRGNDITIVVTEDVDNEGTFIVQTVVDGAVVDSQSVTLIQNLAANNWVTFSGTGAPSETAGVQLTGGADGTVQAAAYTTFLSVIEAYDFDILIYDGTDSTTQAAMVNFVERLATTQGKYAQLVAYNLTTPPNNQYVINVSGDVTGVNLNDGTQITGGQMCWWVGGAQAGANYNESLTYAQYPGAVSVTPALTNDQITAALQAGELVLTAQNNTVFIEWDINSLTTYTAQYSESYHKNRVMRTLSTIANDIYAQFSANYIGVINNNEEGRNLFKGAIVGYLLDMQANNAIQNFTADDVTVSAGESIDSIVIDLTIQPVDAVEKIYLTITVA